MKKPSKIYKFSIITNISVWAKDAYDHEFFRFESIQNQFLKQLNHSWMMATSWMQYLRNDDQAYSIFHIQRKTQEKHYDIEVILYGSIHDFNMYEHAFM